MEIRNLLYWSLIILIYRKKMFGEKVRKKTNNGGNLLSRFVTANVEILMHR